jgi:benzoate 4-monooxygenase
MFVRKWTELASTQKNPKTGFASIDALHWFNYLAFDIIGDLAFGAPFGMLEHGRDVAEIRKTPDAPPTYAPAIEVLNRRGEVSGTLGCLPQWKPYAKHLPDPFFSKGVKAVENLAGIAVARVSQRLDNPDVERVDLLARLMQGKDADGKPLGRQELTAEALTQLIAGSDTTSNTSCALLYWVLRTPGVLEKLQKELDDNIPSGVPSYDAVKELPYLTNVVQETLRIHSTSSLGLPRLVPGASPENPEPKGVEILGYHFPPGTVLSVPAYTIHHSKEIWGKDADEFRPERLVLPFFFWCSLRVLLIIKLLLTLSFAGGTPLPTARRNASSPSPPARAAASARMSRRWSWRVLWRRRLGILSSGMSMWARWRRGRGF